MWLPPLKQCSTGSLSLEFATKDPNGLLLYNGPTSPVEEGDAYDFVAVELSKGRVLVSMSLGNVSDNIHVGVTKSPALNDGKWHFVEVYMNGTVGTRYCLDIRELKKNGRGRRRQRRQINKTNYTRRKAHVNI